jgi:hypothetical protein
MRRLLGTLIALAAMSPSPGMSAGTAATSRRATLKLNLNRVTEPYTWREDFQGAALGQFASYPPVQDVGYDPSLEPTIGYGAPGGRSLMRILKPVRSGPERFGFIRRLDLIATPGAVLSFSYRFEGPASSDHIEIGIAGSNKHRYVTTIPMGAASAWHRARLNAAEFRDDSHAPLPAGVGIDGLYVVAALGRADRDIAYHFLIDDLSFQAKREMRFELRRPHAMTLEPRTDLFATTSLRPGDSFGVEARAPVHLAGAECVVSDQDGKAVGHAPLYDDGTHGDRAANDSVWTNEAVPAGPREPGVYRLELIGTTTGNASLRTMVRALRTAAAPAAHPRVYLDASDRRKLIERSQSAKYGQIWQQILLRAQAARNSGDLRRGIGILPMLDREYLLPTLPGYFDLISKASARIQYNALVAYITGEAEAGEAARSAMLAVMQWKSWAPPWFAAHGQATYYPAGELTQQVAFAYDLLYDRLSPEDRRTIRAGLLRNGIIPAYQEYVQDNRILANTSNWIAHSVASALVAAAAIQGEETAPDLDLYTNGLLDKLAEHLSASYLADGSYGEGISYHEFDLETLAPALVTLQRVFGLDYWSRSYAKDSLWYPISTLADPTSGCLDMGDSHCPSGRTIAPIVAHSNIPVFRWYEDRLKPSSIEEFLFADDTLPSKPPEEPGSRYFRNKGAVVFRTGWKPDDAILLFRAGPNFNHNHAGQGGFLFRALGENLVSEAGYADYYKDPYYDSYFKQAAGHNTVLVDGDPASQEVADTLAFPALHQYPKITSVITSMDFDAVTSELRQVYRGRLKHFTRRLAFIKPDCLIVYDELVPAERESFGWLLHLPDVSHIKTEPNTATYKGAKASLAVRFLSPDALKLNVTEGHLPYSTFNPVAPAHVPLQPAILTATTEASAEPIRILAALAPGRSVASANQMVGRLRRIDAPGWTGVGHDDEILMFRQFSAPRPGTYNSWTTDADAWLLRGTPENPRLLSALGATNLRRGSTVWFSSSRPASFVAAYKNGRIDLSVYSDEAQSIRMRALGGEMTTLEINAGSSKFELPGERP